jgi:ABC-2 type transport system ATP-binding protein
VPPPVVLSAEGLTKRFGDLVAVQDLSLEVREGEILGLLGPNGAGKTTSISMICGLLAPDSGRTLLRGAVVRGDVRSKIGMCPQQVIVWKDLTCLEQLVHVGELYGMRRTRARERSAEILAALGLAEKRDALAGTLSGGMQRRLNLALALVHEPEIVVLDEPEAGLDPQSRVLVRDYVRSLAEHQTVILTTHNLDEAQRLAARVAIIDHGRLLAQGTPEALVSHVGPGDVLELGFALGTDLGPLQATLAGLIGEVKPVGSTLVLRAQGLVARLGEVMDAVRAQGQAPGEVRLRENSLEDVFISLTGRGLRE